MNNKGDILIVDDEAIEQQSLVDILTLEGYHVSAVDSGPAAIDFLRHNPVDVMVLDLRMPGMNGLEVVKAVGGMCPDLVIILLTAYGSMESAVEALRWRVHDYLLKPASPEHIVESVQRGMRQKKARLQDPGKDTQPKIRKSSSRSSGVADIDFNRRQITCGKAIVILTPAEGRLLKIFMENPGKVFKHRDLVLLVQGYSTSFLEAPEILRPLVSRLRQKCDLIPELRDRIVSVRGTGYYFNGEEK